MIFVDSSVWIDFFNGKITGETDYLNNILGHSLIFTGELVVTEVLQGFRNKKDYNLAKALFRRLIFQTMSGWELAVKSAENYRFLSQKGKKPRKTIDTIIATFCIINNFSLLHCDNDYNKFIQHCGLKVIKF